MIPAPGAIGGFVRMDADGTIVESRLPSAGEMARLHEASSRAVELARPATEGSPTSETKLLSDKCQGRHFWHFMMGATLCIAAFRVAAMPHCELRGCERGGIRRAPGR